MSEHHVKPEVGEAILRDLYERGLSVRDIAAETGLTTTTTCRRLAEYGMKGERDPAVQRRKARRKPAEPRPVPEKGLLSRREAAQYLGVPVSAIYYWTQAGRLPHARTLGGHFRYDRSDLDALRAKREWLLETRKAGASLVE